MKNIYKSVWFLAAISILLLSGFVLGNNGFVVSKSSAAKNQISKTISSKVETTVSDTVLHWDGANSSGVGDGITPWRGIVVFTPTELDPFVGTHEISEVWAWMRTPLAWDSVLVEIYEGVTINPAGPSTIDLGTMLYSQDITAEITTLDDWTIHTLSNPVAIQNGEIYAAVIFVEQNQASPPAYPIGTDAGPMVAERGGWVWDPTLPNGAQLADFGINFNWNIRMGLSTVVGIGNDIVLRPSGFTLHQNYPNPFNPATTITYQLTNSANVVLKIYDLSGQEMKTLVNEKQSAGAQQVVWDGMDNNGHQVASGIYLYKLRTGNQTQTKKMVLLK